jgi:acetyl esterase/lipase
MEEYLNIPYSPSLPPNSYRELDFYVPTTDAKEAQPLICFIHGGAWVA